jgi:hypothetical protein
MKVSSLAIVCLSVSIFGAAQASAHWQYTRWGMNPKQVATNSKGTTSEGIGVPGDNVDGFQVGDIGQYTSGNYKFRAAFYFQNNVLSIVSLKLNDAGYDHCLALQHDLEGRYGKPYDKIDSAIAMGMTWHDVAAKNFMSILIIGSDASATCTLSYKPLTSESAGGL